MQSYLDIIRQVLYKGQWKGNRTGVKANTIANVHWEHYMEDGFPLLTTKKMAFQLIIISEGHPLTGNCGLPPHFPSGLHQSSHI